MCTCFGINAGPRGSRWGWGGGGRPTDLDEARLSSRHLGNGFSRFKKTQNQSERGPDVLTLRFRELEPRRLREGGRREAETENRRGARGRESERRGDLGQNRPGSETEAALLGQCRWGPGSPRAQVLGARRLRPL